MNNRVTDPSVTDPAAEAREPLYPMLLTAEEAAAKLAICRTKVYELLRNGHLASIRIGASRRIPVAALAEYVQRLRGEQNVDPGMCLTFGQDRQPFSEMGTIAEERRGRGARYD